MMPEFTDIIIVISIEDQRKRSFSTYFFDKDTTFYNNTKSFYRFYA